MNSELRNLKDSTSNYISRARNSHCLLMACDTGEKRKGHGAVSVSSPQAYKCFGAFSHLHSA